MVRMTAVWDRATNVIAGRASILASLALLFVWLPGLVQRALPLLGGGAAPTPAPSPGLALVVGLVGLAAALLSSVGHLAMVAVASDPAVSRAEAVAIALRRFLPYLGLVVLLVIAATVVAVPLIVAIVSAYPSVAAMRAGALPQMSPGTGLFVLVYGLAAAALGIWLEARLLSVLAPVIVNERLGIGSYARAFHLTRGLTWRIIGVVLLFALVAAILLLAVQSVVGIVFRLILGFAGLATAAFLTGAVVSLLACALAVVVSAFTAQLYVAAREGPLLP